MSSSAGRDRSRPRAESRAGAPLVAGFTVVGELGRGAGTVVYRVRRGGRDYAMKVRLPGSVVTDSELTAYRREAALLALAASAALPAVHEVGVWDGRPYLVMELVEGELLARVLLDGPMPETAVLRLACDVAEALAALHQVGLTHRDVKPANVIVQPDGRARIIDLGLAAASAAQVAQAVVGTPDYASPEQAGSLARVVDARSDLYSLGVVLVECVTGRRPFVSADVGELLQLHATAPAPDLRTLLPGVSPGLADVVATLLAKDPDDRYQSATALLADLRRVLADPKAPITVRRSAGAPPPRAALAGRDAERAELFSLWRTALRGSGVVAIVRGEPGAGVSRLLEELARHVGDAGYPVLALPADTSAPLASLRAGVQALVAQAGRLDPTRRARAVGLLADAVAVAPAQVARLSPALMAFLRAEGFPVDAEVDERPAGEAPDEFIAGLAAFLAELARGAGGLCLVVDYAEGIDVASRRVMWQVARGFGTVPALMAAGAVPSDPVPPPAGTVQTTAMLRTIVLGRLDDAAVATLVRHATRGLDLDDALVAELAARAGRTPLEVLELVTAVVDAGLLTPSWGTWHLDVEGLATLELPRDVRGLVTRRIDRMDPGARTLLEVAALVGRAFRADVVARVAGVPGPEVAALLAGAQADGVLVRRGAELAFADERTRAALVARMDEPERADLHRRIARELDERTDGYALAGHYLEAGVVEDPARAARTLTGAGERALAEHAGEDAVRFLERAAELTGPQDVARLRVPLSDAYAMTGRLADALATLDAALSATSDPVERAQLRLRIARGRLAAWDTEGALAVAREGLAELRSCRVPGWHAVALAGTVAASVAVETTGIGFGGARASERARLQAVADLAQVGEEAAVRSGRLVPATLLSFEARLPATRLGPSLAYVHFRGNRAVISGILGLPGAGRSLARAQRAADALGAPEAEALVGFGRAMSRALRPGGDASGLTDVLARGRALPLAEYLQAVFLASFDLLGRGHTHQARSWYEQATARLGAADLADHTLELLGLATAAGLGWVPEADARARQLEADPDRFAGPGLRPGWFATTVYAAVEQRQLGARLVTLAEQVRGLDWRPIPQPLRVLFPLLASGLLERCRTVHAGERDAAVADAERAVAMMRRLRMTPVAVAHRLVCEADLLLVRGEPRRALAALAASQDHLLEHDVPLATFGAALVRARACAALGLPAEATAHAAFALSLAEQLGWPHRASWVRREFPEAGGAPTDASAVRHSLTLTGDAGAPGTLGRRLAALEQLSLAASRIVDPTELTRVALDQIIRTLGAERAFLFLAEGEDSALVPHLGRELGGHDLTELTEYGSTLVERVRVSHEPLVVTGTDEGAALGSRSAVMHDLRSIMVAPLLLDNRLIGVVYLDSRIAKGVFTPADVGTLAAITTHVAAALETARAAELGSAVRAAEQQLRVAETMRDAMNELASTLDPREVLGRLRTTMANALPAEASALHVLDGGRLGPPSERSHVHEPALTADARDLLASWAQALAPVAGSGATGARLAGADPAATRSWLAVPLRVRDSLVGVVALASARRDAFGAAEVELAAAMAGQGMVAYDNARLFAEVGQLAITDSLTGVFNRRHFATLAEELVDEASSTGSPVSAVMLDIDHFKRVNDAYGHPVGDEVIRTVAARVAAVTRSGDLLARYGGEEFALILRHPAKVTAKIAERIRRAFADAPIETAAGPVSVTVSVGIAHRGAQAASLAALLARADKALYEAKQTGRNRVVVSEASAEATADA